MRMFDGKKHARLLDIQIKAHIQKNSVEGALGIVQIGDDPGSNKYIDIKKKYCQKLGISISLLKLDEYLSDEVIYKRVGDFFKQKSIKGGIIQLPLPRASLNKILDLIPEDKDIDLLSSQSLKKFYQGDFSKLSPVIRSFDYFIQKNNIKLKEKMSTIIGNGFLIGKPIVKYLNQSGSNTAIIEQYSTGTPINCHSLVLGAGEPNLVMGEDINKGCNVVDFGYSLFKGKSTGDLCLDSKLDHLGVISPSPGGLGPLVVRFLIMNFLGI